VVLEECGAWGLIVPPSPPPLTPVPPFTPPTKLIEPSTFWHRFRTQFLLSSFLMTCLHLLGDIPTSLHLWRLPLLLRFLRCVLCPMEISPLPRLLTLLFWVGLHQRAWLLLSSSLLLCHRRFCRVLLLPPLFWLLSPSPLSALQSLSGFPRSTT
jgi:hypothetical protein